MKVKLAVALAVLFLATAAHADSTIVLGVTASTCTGCDPGVNLPSINLDVQFTLEQATGTFYNSDQQFFFTGTEYEVLSMSGTLNGSPVALAQAPLEIGSWLDDPDFGLGSVFFTADGSLWSLENDHPLFLLEGLNVPITWNTVELVGTPEPAAYTMLIAGFIGLIALRRLLSNLNWRPPDHKLKF
jgi:hypothetical protein